MGERERTGASPLDSEYNGLYLSLKLAPMGAILVAPWSNLVLPDEGTHKGCINAVRVLRGRAIREGHDLKAYKLMIAAVAALARASISLASG